jgi:hypothetical protein
MRLLAIVKLAGVPYPISCQHADCFVTMREGETVVLVDDPSGSIAIFCDRHGDDRTPKGD